MAKAFRIWIDIEEFDTDNEEATAQDVPADFGPSALFVVQGTDEVSVSRARDKALGFAEQLHEAAADIVKPR